MASVFYSYSHRDEALRDKLEAHLSVMKRQGEITAWHDRQIVAGSDINVEIAAAMQEADVFLLLVSSDFLNSNYCQDVELKRALEMSAQRKAAVIPVILRPCDWKSTPLGDLMAAPTDGKAIVTWNNEDEAFLNVVHAIRAALRSVGGVASQPAYGVQPAARAVSAAGPRSTNLRVVKIVTEVDRDRHLVEAFEYIAKFFENSIVEISRRNDGIDGTFSRIDASTFTGVIYRNGAAFVRCTIRIDNTLGSQITYASSDRAPRGSFNDAMTVQGGPEGVFLKPMGTASFRKDKSQPLTFEGAGEYFWEILVHPLKG